MGQAAAAAARTQVQDWLDKGSELIMRGDFDAWSGTTALPCLIETGRSRIVIQNEAGLKAGFDGWRNTLIGNGITEMVRTVREVHGHDDETLTATFDVDLLCRAVRIVPTFASWMLLRRSGPAWRLSHLVSGLANQHYPFTILQIDGGAPDRIARAAGGPDGQTAGGPALARAPMTGSADCAPAGVVPGAGPDGGAG